MRVVAARDVEPDAVTGLEHVTGRKRFDGDLVPSTWRHHGWSFPRVAVPAANDPIREVHRETFGIVLIGGIDVDQLRGEIRVGAVGRDPQSDHERTRDLDIFAERFSLKNENVVALSRLVLIGFYSKIQVLRQTQSFKITQYLK